MTKTCADLTTKQGIATAAAMAADGVWPEQVHRVDANGVRCIVAEYETDKQPKSSLLRAAELALELRGLVDNATPETIVRALPNGKALVISAGTSPDEARSMLAEALRL